MGPQARTGDLMKGTWKTVKQAGLGTGARVRAKTASGLVVDAILDKEIEGRGVRRWYATNQWEERSTYERVTTYAMTHAQALTMRSKFRLDTQARMLLVEAETVPACAGCGSFECCPEEGWCSRQHKRGGCPCHPRREAT